MIHQVERITTGINDRLIGLVTNCRNRWPTNGWRPTLPRWTCHWGDQQSGDTETCNRHLLGEYIFFRKISNLKKCGEKLMPIKYNNYHHLLSLVHFSWGPGAPQGKSSRVLGAEKQHRTHLTKRLRKGSDRISTLEATWGHVRRLAIRNHKFLKGKMGSWTTWRNTSIYQYQSWIHMDSAFPSPTSVQNAFWTTIKS